MKILFSSLLVGLIIEFTFVQDTVGLSCLPCEVNVECPVLPQAKWCFPARLPCSCCDQCAGLIGSPCGSFKIRCHPEYVCVNEKGEEKETVEWYETFKGVCNISAAIKKDRRAYRKLRWRARRWTRILRKLNRRQNRKNNRRQKRKNKNLQIKGHKKH